MLLMPITSRLAQKIGAIDIPKLRSIHTTPKPRMGGIAISISFVIICLIFLPVNAFFIAFLTGLIAIVITGAIDDIMEISPGWKFLGQFLSATLFVYLSGMQVEYIGDILSIGDIELGKTSVIFTVFLLVGIINALNFADGLDSLAGGISVIALVFLGYFAWSVDREGLMIIAISLIGAIIGFLRHNSYPTRVFMGDSGSMMLGYVLGVMLVSLSHTAPQLPLSALAMVIALPLFDTLSVMTWRISSKNSPFLSDRTHLHHRLIDIGLSHPTVVSVIYLAMFAFGLLAIMLQSKPDWVIFLSLISAGLLVFSWFLFVRRTGIRSKKWTIHYFDKFRQSDIYKLIAHWLDRWHSIGISILVALLLPALLAPLLGLSGGKVLMLFGLAVLLVFFSFRTRRAADLSILHGTLYLNIFALILVYNLSVLVHFSWLHEYISALSAIAWLWVVLNLAFTECKEIILLSDFELLVLLIIGFVAFIFMRDLQVSPLVLQAVQHTFLLSIPFMMVMKINIRNHGQDHLYIFLPVMALVIMATRISLA
ncbi:UDP-GlcNAc:undecaprenyl-phosphate GlcNAc-1-phosphate transferase [Nitrosomonas ureae]|uniref:UDP-GlcNAc:undecaprenyl-phosphate GlcNAc-1-phosphate transferase n=2 Tax=Nitrosomonas ureae TaxID=44577 RepID=A0A2T5IPZ2_9PROT|nr:UDP-GlcNAc:undecaprenyl-phosphate GlcNAc-1-phosphate transferase [Nitrosomonas ureae]